MWLACLAVVVCCHAPFALTLRPPLDHHWHTVGSAMWHDHVWRRNLRHSFGFPVNSFAYELGDAGCFFLFAAHANYPQFFFFSLWQTDEKSRIHYCPCRKEKSKSDWRSFYFWRVHLCKMGKDRYSLKDTKIEKKDAKNDI